MRQRLAVVMAVLAVLGLTQSIPVTAARAALPAGFARVLHASRLRHPTAMAFEGSRILVAQKIGVVRIVNPNGTVRAEPYVTLHVSTEHERGLLGVAIDPKYAKNHYVYLYYTTGPGAKQYSGMPVNRVSRFKTKDGTGQDEEILLDKIPSDTGMHDGGDIHFGFDGKLYIAVGDGGNYAEGAGLLNTLRGKILRITRGGKVPRDNPFVHTPTALPQIFALGFRNPFRFALRASNQTYLVGDVGDLTWEELDTLKAGADYGWVRYEGPCPYAALKCDPVLTDFGTTTAPIHAYHHLTGTETGSTIIAGSFPRNSNYPVPFNEAFFYGDWAQGWIHALTLDATNRVIARHDFDTGIRPVSFATGPDGNIYVLDYRKGRIYKYVYTP